MTPDEATKINSSYAAATQTHICAHCGRDTWDMQTNPCQKCPCRNCGGSVSRTLQTLNKKDCCPECKRAFEKAVRTEAIRKFRETRAVSNATSV